MRKPRILTQIDVRRKDAECKKKKPKRPTIPKKNSNVTAIIKERPEELL